MAGKVEIIGIGELVKNFKMLNSDIVKKTSLRMVATAGGVLRKESKRIAQEEGLKKTGALIRNIAIKKERNADPGTTQYNLGVRHGRHLGNGKKVEKYLALNKTGRIVNRRENDPFYWRFLEFGTKHISASRFLQRSLENKRQEAIKAMNDRLLKEIEKYK